MLELLAHQAASFSTLTYAPEHLPADGSLSDVHWRELTKSLGYRYFGCGEYGDQTWRPHYHLILFGIAPGASQALLTARWPYGYVQTAPDAPTAAAAAYIASYTVKKLTNGKDDYVLDQLAGRAPEFARMSRRPAIGWPGLQFLRDWLTTAEGCRYISRHGDVPNAVSIGRKTFPLGRTMVAKLRDWVDLPATDPARLDRAAERVIALEEVQDREMLRQGRYDVLKARQRAARRVL